MKGWSNRASTIACLSVPYFAATVERRDDTRLAGNPVVVGGQPWEPRPVYAFSHEVAQQGVKPGMSLRLAHILSPHSRFIPATPPRYFGASGEITDVLTDFTHLVEPEELWLPAHDPAQQKTAAGRSLPARYTLDLESLPPAEALSLAQEIGQSVRRHTHLAPAIGLAESKFTAQVAAALTRPNHARPVPSGEEARFLASRSIQFLPLDKEAARRLSLLGIRTLGQLADLPLTSLQTQFGPEFMALYRLAQGCSKWKDERLLSRVQPLVPERQEQVAHRFEAPIADTLVLENVLARMATELSGRLQAASLEGRTLCLTWETERQQRAQAWLSRRLPTAGPKQLADSLYELLHQVSLLEAASSQETTSSLEAASLKQGIVALTVTLTDLTPATACQLALFEPPKARNQVGDMLGNLVTKHGAEYFYRPVLTHDHHPLPERRFHLRGIAAT